MPNRGLTRLAWRSLRARRLRTTLTALGVALGVAVLFAGLATNAGIDASVDRTVSTLVGRADLRISSFGEGGLSAETAAQIASTPGVAVASPSFERRTYLGAELGAPEDALPPPVTFVGIDPVLEPRLHDMTLAAGAALARPNEPSALITATLARQDRLGVGDELTILGPGEPAAFRVVGILAADGPWSGSAGRAVVVPLATALRTFGTAGLTRVDVGVAPGPSVADVSAALQSALHREPYVLSSPRDLAASMRASTGEFAATTALIAAVALFAGAFLIFNTLSMTVAERVRELGLLRAA